MKHTVRDGLYPVEFEGDQLAAVSTETWSASRWVELELYRIPAQPDPTGRISLPRGGYLTHVIGQSLVAHRRNSRCNTGVPTKISDLPDDAVPCDECNPEFPVCMNINDAAEVASVRAARARDLDGVVDLESPRHSLHRTVSAAETVRKITGRQLSTPAQRLLETAAISDEEIKKIIAA